MSCHAAAVKGKCQRSEQNQIPNSFCVYLARARPRVAELCAPMPDLFHNVYPRRRVIAGEPTNMLRKQLLDSSRGRIVTLLQRGALTVDDIAARMGLTTNAVRVQITGMERDGVVQRAGQRPGATRPSNIFELTSEVEQLLSRAYIPFLTQLVRIFADGLPQGQVDAFFREAGKGMVEELALRARVSGDLRTRVKMASDLLNDELGPK